MNFQREGWVKAYKKESLTNKSAPVHVRGLRYYLLVLAEDDGTLLRVHSGHEMVSSLDTSADSPRTRPRTNPDTSRTGADNVRTTSGRVVDALVDVLAPADFEREMTRVGIQFLLADGYLSLDTETGRIWITNFVEAQRSRTKDAERKAKRRASEKARAAAGTEQVDLDTSADSPRTVRGHSAESPLEKKRREEKRNTAAAAAVARASDAVGSSSGKGEQQVTPHSEPVAPSTTKVPCPADLRLTSDQAATLQTSLPGLEQWAVDALTTKFVAKHQADQSDTRSLVNWRKALSSAICGDWQHPSRRPTKPHPDEAETAEALKRRQARNRALIAADTDRRRQELEAFAAAGGGAR